jgi:hypothetical protein
MSRFLHFYSKFNSQKYYKRVANWATLLKMSPEDIKYPLRTAPQESHYRLTRDYGVCKRILATLLEISIFSTVANTL